MPLGVPADAARGAIAVLSAEVMVMPTSDRETTDRPARTLRVPDHDTFVAMCARRGIDPQRADAVWQDMTQGSEIVARRGLSRAVLGTAVIGAMLLSAAGIWWATLVTSAAGAPGLVGLALAWIVAATAAAEAAQRRMIPYVDAVASVVAVAYTGVAVGAALYWLAGPRSLLTGGGVRSSSRASSPPGCSHSGGIAVHWSRWPRPPSQSLRW